MQCATRRARSRREDGEMGRKGGERRGEADRNTIKRNARGALAQELKKEEFESIFLNLLNSCRILVGGGVEAWGLEPPCGGWCKKYSSASKEKQQTPHFTSVF